MRGWWTRVSLLWASLLWGSLLLCGCSGESAEADVQRDVEPGDMAVDVAPDVQDTTDADTDVDLGEMDVAPDADIAMDGDVAAELPDLVEVVDAVTEDMREPFPLPGPPVLDGLAYVDVASQAGLNRTHWAQPAEFRDVLCGSFSTYAGGAAVADIDGDGDHDILLTHLDDANELLVNDGTGQFTDVSVASGIANTGSSFGAGFGDIDGDGDLDVVLTHAFEGVAQLLVNDNGVFTEDASRLALPDWHTLPCLAFASVTFADTDRDGDLDLYLAQWGSGMSGPRSLLMINDGNGFFTDQTVALGADTIGRRDFTAAFADMNGDLWPDLMVAADFNTSSMFLNNGDGSFTEVTDAAGVNQDESGMGSAVGDIDGDGDLDWYVTSILDERPSCEDFGCKGNMLYINNGNGVFEEGGWVRGLHRGSWGWGAAMFDANNDGSLDIGSANGYYTAWTVPSYLVRIEPFIIDPLRLWLNPGDFDTMLQWNEVAAPTGMNDTRRGRAFIPFDLEMDGDLDVLVTNNGDTPALFRNDLPARPWLRVRLRGVTNTHGIGAQVWVTMLPGSTPIRRDVTANSTYVGYGPFEAHFGLTYTTPTVHEVRVVWPDTGMETVLNDVSANQVLTVVQQ